MPKAMSWIFVGNTLRVVTERVVGSGTGSLWRINLAGEGQRASPGLLE